MTSQQIGDRYLTAIQRARFLVEQQFPSGAAATDEKSVFELSQNQKVFARAVADARSSTRTAAALCGLFGVQVDQELFRKYEIVQSDPASEAVADLMDYDGDKELKDPNEAILSSMEVDADCESLYARELLDLDDGGIMYKELLTDILRTYNGAKVVDMDRLGSVAEFVTVGSSTVTDEELDSEFHSQLLSSLTKEKMKEISQKG